MRPVDEVKAYVLMPVPVYMFMKHNQKFVAVKEPLDFFVPEELEKLRPVESLFFSDFLDVIEPFEQSARRIRMLLATPPAANPHNEVKLTPAAFEISDAVLQVLGSLWASTPASAEAAFIETFFPAIFANQLCENLKPELLLRAREKSVLDFELALLRSSWAVFLALHLGYCDLEFLNVLRIELFERSLSEVQGGEGFSIEIDELTALVFASIQGSEVRNLSSRWFEDRDGRVARKISSRLKRVQNELLNRSLTQASVFGEKGILHD
ncbi:MAG: hypothetical protein H7222_03575 [Methylotenera sp.]|nr:hypothetical protein [Oligoflexia bacterium]